MLISTQVDGVVEIIFRGDVAKNHARLTAEESIDVYAGCHFYITTAYFGTVHVHLQKPRLVCKVANAPLKIVHINSKHYPYLLDTLASNSDRLVYAVHYIPAMTDWSK